MRLRGRIHATWAVLVVVISFNGWTQATRDPAGMAADAAWSASQGRAVAVERAASSVLSVRARNPMREENGSGVVVDAAGYAITAHHVVYAATEIFVRDRDGNEFPAAIRGYDEAADLALLAIDAPGRRFDAIRLAESARARVGESVVALGGPFGLAHSATAGILSAVGRTEVVTDNVVPLLQTDAAINPGSSGGPLINLRGELLGVVNAIMTRTGRDQGIGFAVPADEIARVLPYLRRGEPVLRPWIGVRVRTGQGDGVEVISIIEQGPAAAAGLRPGDRIVRFAGQSVSDSGQLRRLLRALPIGKPVEIEARRGTDSRTIQLSVGTRQRKPSKILKRVGR